MKLRDEIGNPAAAFGGMAADLQDIQDKLFPENSGAVFVLSATRDMLEAAAVWGPLPPTNLTFPPNEC